MGQKGWVNLRMTRMAAERILRERFLPRGSLDTPAMAMLFRQLRRIVQEMKTEWETDPTSVELKDAFLLVLDYVDQVKKCRVGSGERQEIISL